MSNFEYIVLDKPEERSIRRFYEDLSTLGDFHFSISREPDFFEAIEVEGNDPEIFVMRRICSREIIGALISSKKECFINALKINPDFETAATMVKTLESMEKPT